MNAVIKSSSYCLAHTPDMVLHNGTTQTTERLVNPTSEYLEKLPSHLRTYDNALTYPPNQAYIGGITPATLGEIALPWYDKPLASASRTAKFGEIMPQDEFYILMQVCDAFDLIQLEQDFVASVAPGIGPTSIFTQELRQKIKPGITTQAIELLLTEGAEGLYQHGKLVGCVKKAHDVDENLSAHVILENLVSKASCVLSLLHLSQNLNGIDKSDIELVIDCSEEAVGDMNQRGGGNMAKASAEIVGFTAATGADVRAFCAAPVHAIIHAAALVKSGTYKNVVVTAGGSTAKLGMNGKDHVKKELPILEDVVGAFAVLISQNDNTSPEILSEYTGWHSVGSGSSPQAVMTALVVDPLTKMGLKITDVDKFSVEMHNPDVTKPAGAGDVPQANYKMIGALAVTKGQLERTALNDFIIKHGMVGWAPTQGHIPSGVPYIGFACDQIVSGEINNCMVIGKGSLFLGRMTNLFDGCSFVIRKNAALQAADASANASKEATPAPSNTTGAASTNAACCTTSHDNAQNNCDTSTAAAIGKPHIAILGIGSEHGEANQLAGALQAINAGINLTYVGTTSAYTHAQHDNNLPPIHFTLANGNRLRCSPASCEKDATQKIEHLLNNELDAAVMMHYTFPVGVSTVGRVVTPARGKHMYIATTTGAAHTNKICGMVKNAIYGIISAKACGIPNPSIGILNIEGALQVERALKKLHQNGYHINFAKSGRSDGGAIMRGNDALTASCDIMVCDPLTGNILTKMLSAFTSGGDYETSGFGYGPGIGEDVDKLVLIVSRASGAPVVAGAIEYAAQLVQGGWKTVLQAEFAAAKKAGLDAILEEILQKSASLGLEPGDISPTTPIAPQKEIVTAEIAGIDILELDNALAVLLAAGIYAESGMGCTGPILLVNDAKLDSAMKLLEGMI